ncbi:MAG: hypothetical protein HRT69_03090 [Flavobacteriaceae bacterium]|nr:hypothetical protein [Flavobacteriaceae bacterium]
MLKNLFQTVCAVVFLLSTNTSIAQVGIGTTTPNADAQLDISSANRGILMPRIALTATTSPAPLTTDVAGMMVYNTATAGDVTPGFYYNDGAVWVSMTPSASAAWDLAGNAGTTPGVANNFLGTTDNQDLVIGTNSIEVFRFTAPDGSNDPKLLAGNGGNHGDEQDPIYTFSNDDNTGIWSDSADEFSLGAGGQEMITMDEGATEGDVVIINEDGDDMNFRVESDDNSLMFHVEGNDNQVQVNAGTILTGSHLSVGTQNATEAMNIFTSSSGDAIYNQSTGTGYGMYFITNDNSSIGVYADNSALTTDSNDAIVGHANNNEGFGGGWFLNSNGSNGTGYGTAEQGYGVLGMNTAASNYSVGVLGSVQASGGSGRRSSGVFGSNSNGTTQNAAGALGYRPSAGGTYYGGYFFDNNGGVDHIDGADRMSSSSTSTVKVNVGMGAIGGLMGGWAKGSVYGFTTKGDRYSLYVQGREFTNDVITQLSDNNNNERIASYVPTSTSVDITSKGMNTLNNGTARISFSKNFSSIASKKDPVIVTITPIGESKGIHLVSIDNTGFTIKENANGSSNVNFTWIAVATKAGYETMTNPEELLAADYDTKLNNFMIDESVENPKGQEMWWDGSQIRYSGTPESTEFGYSKAKIKELTPSQKRRAKEGLKKETIVVLEEEKDGE